MSDTERTNGNETCPKCDGEDAYFLDGKGPKCRNCGWSAGEYRDRGEA